MTQNPDGTSGFASPPCFAHELESTDNGYAVVDAAQATDVSRWRKAERMRLIEMRLAVPAGERRRIAEQVTVYLDQLIDHRANTIVSLYWPFRGELNLRDWMHQLVECGVRVVLPVVEAKATPLTFREWTPDATLVPGVWNIPVPAEGDVLEPTIVISPLVGFDPAHFRLGYGGGFFDRTLAAMHGRGLKPRVLGVGHSCAAIPTIYPQPHDVPMTDIITEWGILAHSDTDT